MSIAGDEMADRIRSALGHRPGITEKRMFGGICFMLNGNMVACATKAGNLMIRIDPAARTAALERPGAGPMQMGSKEMHGFLEISDEGIESASNFTDWLAYAETFVKTLPAK
ncbi:MAG TPA: TfoX/Sxy family protein [Devosiaceae bacterium]|jgi:TfoX/Sxy family transcriptional regulator of competence genes